MIIVVPGLNELCELLSAVVVLECLWRLLLLKWKDRWFRKDAANDRCIVRKGWEENQAIHPTAMILDSWFLILDHGRWFFQKRMGGDPSNPSYYLDPWSLILNLWSLILASWPWPWPWTLICFRQGWEENQATHPTASQLPSRTSSLPPPVSTVSICVFVIFGNL